MQLCLFRGYYEFEQFKYIEYVIEGVYILIVFDIFYLFFNFLYILLVGQEVILQLFCYLKGSYWLGLEDYLFVQCFVKFMFKNLSYEGKGSSGKNGVCIGMEGG